MHFDDSCFNGSKTVCNTEAKPYVPLLLQDDSSNYFTI